MPEELRRWKAGELVFYLLVIAGVLVSDQYLKNWVISRLRPGETMPLVKYAFHITLVLNKGIAFGLLTEYLNEVLYVVFILTLLLIIIFIYYSYSERFLVKLGLSFLLGGCMGNLADRLRLGFIVDFLDFRVWPVFNLADTAICLGAFLVFIGLITKHRVKNT